MEKSFKKILCRTKHCGRWFIQHRTISTREYYKQGKQYFRVVTETTYKCPTCNLYFFTTKYSWNEIKLCSTVSLFRGGNEISCCDFTNKNSDRFRSETKRTQNIQSWRIGKSTLVTNEVINTFVLVTSFLSVYNIRGSLSSLPI